MKLILFTVMMTALCVNLMAEDAFYVMEHADAVKAEIQDSHLVMKMKLKKIDLPVATAINAFATPGSPQKYAVQVTLAKRPVGDWLPIPLINGKVYFKGVGVTLPDNPKISASFRVCSDDMKEVLSLTKSLARLLKVPIKKVFIEEALTNKQKSP